MSRNQEWFLRQSAKCSTGKRDRVLNPDEIATIWNALQDASFSNEIKDILRLLFLTGQRSGEVCGMVHSEIDLEAGLWKLPSDRTKNGLAHNVPLTTEAMAIVENRLDDDAEKESPLFSRIGSPVQSNAVAQAVRKHLQILNDRWTPHDIRRTVATGMAEIGILPHVIEATLNHVSGFRAGVAGIYNRNAYDREKRNALDRWEAHLYTLIEAKPSKILPFDRKQS
jgi:integrase